MFGIIVSGRPVMTECTTVSATQLAFSLLASPPFNHLVVFLLPGMSLPEDDNCAAVYIQVTPGSEFRLLGTLSPAKPSAIFRTRLESGAAGSSFGVGAVDEDAMTDAVGTNPDGIVTIGISLEPIAQVEAALAAANAAQRSSGPSNAIVKTTGSVGTSQAVSTKVLAQRIIGNAFNFLASFGSDVIPLKAFEEWWKKFERKVDLDPSFLERADG
jgi:protein Hikeshi